MRKIFYVLAIAIVFTLLMSAQVFASEEKKEANEYEVIINELVKDKVITPEKAKEMLDEINAIQEKAAKEGKGFVLPDSLKWLEKFKISGDLRLRYSMEDWVYDPHGGGEDLANLFRIRARVGFQTEVTDNVQVAMGIATTQWSQATTAPYAVKFGDPRSSNVTFGAGSWSAFGHPAIDLDFAYAKYQPWSWLTLEAGKIRGMPFYIPLPSQFIWSNNINPDGAAVQVNYPVFKAGDKDGFSLNALMNASYFIVTSWTANAGAGMWVFQPGTAVKYKDLSATAAFTYYGMQNVVGTTPSVWSSGSNTLRPNGSLQYNYNPLGVNGEIGLATPLKPLHIDFIHYAGLLGEFIYNPNPPTNKKGWEAGFLMGDKSVGARNSWQVSYMYKYLERDAFLDTFPDSDFYKGMTNVEGHVVQLQYAVLKNVIVSLTNYYTRPILNLLTTTSTSGGVSIPGYRPHEELLFLDLVFKF
jgi:hypothetical protein